VPPIARSRTILQTRGPDKDQPVKDLKTDSSDLTTSTGPSRGKISPVDGATSRLVQVPDSDHTWASIGATYKVGPNTSIDFAYSHGFFEDDAPFSQLPASTLVQVPPLVGKANVSVDLISIGWRIHWGGSPYASASLK